MFNFIDNGSDDSIIEFLRKSNVPIKGLPTKQVVDKNGVTRTVHYNPNQKSKYTKYSNSKYNKNDKLHRYLKENFIGKKTSNGKTITEISYEHLDLHRKERDFDDLSIIKAAYKIITTSKATAYGTSVGYTTEYWGEHIVDGKDIGMVVIMKDKGKDGCCLLSIITQFTDEYKETYEKVKETGYVPKEHKELNETIRKRKLKNKFGR